RAHRRSLPESPSVMKYVIVLLSVVLAACNDSGAKQQDKKAAKDAPAAVPEGAPLFRIERAPFEIELAQARGVLAQEASRRDLAQQEAERLKGLVERRAISQKEADQAASSLQQSAAAVQIARARVRQAELNLSYTEVNAPIAGITGRALQSVGSLVAPNADSALLTTLTRGDPIWVRFALSENEYARLRGSQDIQINVEL